MGRRAGLAAACLLLAWPARADPAPTALMQVFLEVCLTPPFTVAAEADRLRDRGWRHGDRMLFEVDTPGSDGDWGGRVGDAPVLANLTDKPLGCVMSAATVDFDELKAELLAMGARPVSEFAAPMPTLIASTSAGGVAVMLGLMTDKGRSSLSLTLGPAAR